MVAEDQLKEGDGGNSDVKGGGIDLHNAMPPSVCRLEEHCHHLDNDLDGDLSCASRMLLSLNWCQNVVLGDMLGTSC